MMNFKSFMRAESKHLQTNKQRILGKVYASMPYSVGWSQRQWIVWKADSHLLPPVSTDGMEKQKTAKTN